MQTSRHRLGLSALALTGLLAAASSTFALWPRQAPAAQAPHARAAEPAPALTATTSPLLTSEPPPHAASRFEQLSPLRLENQATGETRELKLYDTNGLVDEGAARALDELLCDGRDPQNRAVTQLNRRTLQLLYKAAYHFASRDVEVVSAYRKPGRRREGPHGTGAAIDFRLRGVSARVLASYLRTLPRTGVGIYTHPKTQFVHLDSREHSFHWLDASPPRRHWREKSIGAHNLAEQDRSYSPERDLPD